MSSSAGIQNLLVNVFRPVYTYDSNTGIFTPTLQLANVAYSGTTISVSNVAVGDGNQNVYVGSNAGNSYLDLRGCDNNTALGFSAGGLISNVSNSVYLGYNAGNAASNASNVIAIGSNTGGNGNTNIFIGSETGSTGSNNILIGHSIAGGASNNLLRIGSTLYGNLASRWVGIGTDTPTSGSAFDVSGNARVSGTLSAGTFDVSSGGISSSNLVVSGYLRNALVPTQFDISGGNISNSATLTTSNIRAGAPGNTAVTAIQEFGRGSDALVAGFPAIAFQYRDSAGGYRHFIRTRHDSAGATSGNAIDFFTNTSGVPATSTAPFTGNTLAMAVTSVGVGIGRPNPVVALDVSGRARIVADGSSSLTGYGVGADTLVLQHTGTYDTSAISLGKSASILFANGTANFPQARIVSEMTTAAPSPYTANLIFQTNGVGTALRERMRIHSNGFVGINNAAPSTTLDVSGTFEVTDRNAYFDVLPAIGDYGNVSMNGYFGIYAPGTTSKVLTNQAVRLSPEPGSFHFLMNNNVGIRTRDPSHALDVIGTIRGSNLLTNGYLRDALIPNLFDISQGNIRALNSITAGFTITGFTLIASAAGDVDNPVIRGTTANLGMYFPNTTTTSFVSGGAARFSIDSTGVSNAASTSNTLGGVVLSNNNISNSGTIFSRDSHTVSNFAAQPFLGYVMSNDLGHNWNVAMYNGAGGLNGPAWAGAMVFAYNGAARAYLSSNGNFGLGTSSMPTHTLDVVGTTRTTTLLASGGIRNALIPTTFDISGGNISNSGILTTNIVRTTNTENVFAPSYSFVSDPSLGVYRAGASQLGFASAGLQRMVISNNRVGINQPAPTATLDVSGNGRFIQKNVNLLVTDTSAAFVNIFAAFDTYGCITANGTLSIHNAGTTLAASGSAVPKVAFSADAGSSWTDSRLGVGQRGASYQLDVSAAPNNASINMTTWPRRPASNVLVVRGYSTTLVPNNTLNWLSTVNAIDANLAAFDISASVGSSLVVKKSGIWSISFVIYSTTGGNYAWVDASSGNSVGTTYPPPSSTVIAFGQGPGTTANVNFTGYLPSNDNMYYKFRYAGTPTALNTYLNISFLYETPTISGNYPFP